MFQVSLLEEQREEQTQAENRIFLALSPPSYVCLNKMGGTEAMHG